MMPGFQSLNREESLKTRPNEHFNVCRLFGA